jgi:2-amino-4-hydroxy-6-hydroxymethyldihydropteridine diphosphokinase
MYVTNQPDFLNAVVLGESHLGPLPLLQQLKGLEQELGRHVRKRYGPREIDLDLIAYGSVLYRLEGRLEVPHPRVAERRFVLAPLAELDPERYLPGIGRVASLLKSTIGEPADVVRLTDAVLSI